ncbi:hypothetical protein H3H37_20635 [Duganella sp. LX20W]|uniref:Uncharacterized protein n=1 Tax=Rugamonas brunnea TaxID=2758569 RepID=A0A7W2EVP8_9BURK|nr:hypothetical protein [Rugamonas brunnea]MBA5639474.1 hypothetical protein [Rugamonas brunnea]
MLRTIDNHEVATFALIHGKGAKMWRAVSMELRIPYFFVCHAIKEDGVWLHETCLLWREADVVDFCNEVRMDANRKIVQLSMLLPASEAGRWDMEELGEIWSDSGDESLRSPIFIAHDGRHLSHDGRNTAAVVTTAKERIYSMPTANRSPI